MPILQFKVYSNYEEVIRLRQEIDALENTLRNFGPGTAETTIRNLEAQLAKARSQFTALTEDAMRSGESVEKNLRASVQKMRTGNDVTVRISGDSTDFRKANAQVMRDIDNSLQKLQVYGEQMSGLFSRFAGLTGLSVAGMGMMEFANQMKNVRGEFQQYEVAFETMLGNADKAKSLMGELVQTAAITPFDLSGVTNGAKQLLAYGVSAEDVNKKLIQLGDIAAGLSLSLGDLVYLYGTTITQGRMYTMDLRQFQGRGIPLAKELAKQFGVAESQVGSLVTAGKVTSKEFTKAIESMAGAGGQFGGLMKKQSQTITGQISNIGDAIDSMFNEIGKSSEGVISSALSGTSSLIENWKEVGSVLAMVAVSYGGFKLGDMLNTKLFDQQFDDTMAKLNELQRTAADFKLDDDIKQAVDRGKISAQDATEYQSARDELRKAGAENKSLEQLQEEAAQRLAVAEAMEVERQKLAGLNDEYTKGKPKEMKLDDDLSGQVDAGNATREQAEELQTARNEMQKLAEERQKAADAAGKEAEEYRQIGQLYEDDLKTAERRKEKADEMVASIQEQMDLQSSGMGNNDELVDQLDLEAALREQAAAQTAVETAQEEVNSTAKLANAASSRQAALEEEAQTISRQAETAATGTSTAATNINTASQRGNTAAITGNSLAAKMGAVWDKTYATSKLILSNAVKSVTASMKALTAAIISNPIGMLITGITTAIGLFMAFRSNTEETSQEVTRFGEAAIKTKGNVETLYAVLQATSDKSRTHADALSQLEKIAKDYGFTLDNEKDKYEQLIGLRGRLIELIMEEGRQRQIANNIAKYQDEIQAYADDFRGKMVESIKKENSNDKISNNATATLLASSMIDQMNSERDAIKELIDRKNAIDRELRDHVSQNGWTNGAYEIQKRLAQAQEEVVRKVNEVARNTAENMDVDNYQLDIADAYEWIDDYVSKLGIAESALKSYSEQEEEAQKRRDAAKPPQVTDYSAMGMPELLAKLKETQEKIKEINKATVKPEADKSKVESLSRSAEDAKDKVEAAGAAKASPDSDTSGMDALKDSADTAKDAVDAVDGSTATPGADAGHIDSLTGSVLDAAAALGLVDKTTVAPKMDLTWFEKGYGWIRKMMSGIGISLPEIGGAPVSAGTSSAKAQTDKEMRDIKAALEKQIKDANTKTKLGEARKYINAQLAEAEFGSEEEKYYKKLLKQIDDKDPDKKNKGNGDDRRQREYEKAKADTEEAKRDAEMKAKVEQEAEDLRIASMKEGTEKEIEQIHNDAKKKRDALLKERQEEADRLKEFDRRQWVRSNPKKNKEYAWKQTKKDEEYLSQASENKGYDQKLAEIAYNESAELKKVYAEELAAMRDHLKEYGTFTQRRLAIEDEYKRKIADARNEGERLTYEAEMRNALDGIEAEAINARIDWYSVFDNVGIVMKGQLEPLYRQLQSYVGTDAFRNSGAENQKAVIDAMQKLRQQLGDGNTSWHDLASSMTSYQKAMDELRGVMEEDTRVTTEMNALMNREEDARTALENARTALAKGEGTQTQVDAAQSVYDTAHQAVQDFGKTVSSSALAVQNAEKNVSSSGMLLQQSAISVVRPVSEVTTFLQNSGIPQIGELFAAFDRLKGGIDGLKALSELKKNTDDAKDGVEGLKEGAEGLKDGAEDMVREGADSLIEGLDKSGLIAQVISSVLSILDILKDGVGTLVSNVIDTVLNAVTGIIENILSGDFVRQIGGSLFNGIGGLFKSITTMGGLFDWWGGGDSDPELEKDVERLTLTNDALRRAIEDLTDEMRDASISDIKMKYEDTKSKYGDSQSNTQEMMSREGAAYSSGFLGVGGKRSSNKKVDDAMSIEEWTRISKITGRSVTSAADFWNLTSEQMAKVAKEAPDLYAKIKQYADDGYKDAAQYMDEYIGYYEELESLREAYYEALTSISLDGVKDEFRSLLGDMESTAEDFADSFENMMRQAVINAFINDIFSSQIEKWYEDFVKAMESDNGLSAYEQSQLQRQWDDMARDAIEQRDALAAAMGWDSSVSQQSSSRSISSMSQDTGNAIEGRLTAIQLATESIRASEQAGVMSLAKITEGTLALLNRNNAMTQYYEGMERQIAKCYLELMAINENTGAIVKPIQDMRGFLNEMNKKL